jgi:hypothetical protein
MNRTPSYPCLSTRTLSAGARRIDFVCNVTLAVAGLGIAVAFLWPASDQHPPAPSPR